MKLIDKMTPWVVAIMTLGVVLNGSAATASGYEHVGSVHSSVCRPEPPDYPGCSPQQVRPTRAQYRSEFTAHASHYRYIGMGQHRVSVLRNLPAKLNEKLQKVYLAAVRVYHRNHVQLRRSGQLQPDVPVWPKYRTWVGFKTHTTSACSPGLAGTFPGTYCAGWWHLSRGNTLHILWSVTKMYIGCTGVGVSAAAYGALRTHLKAELFTLAWKDGFYDTQVGTIGCLMYHVPVVHDWFVGAWGAFTNWAGL